MWLYSRTVSSIDPTVFCFAVFIVAIDFALIWLLEKLIGDEGSGATDASVRFRAVLMPFCWSIR